MKKLRSSDTLTHSEETLIGLHPGDGKTPQGEWTIHILSGQSAGKAFTFSFGQEVLVGRQEECQICLIHNLISRHHAKFTWEGRNLLLEDLGSTNGTFVNQRRIDSVKLDPDDRIQIGNSIFRIRLMPLPQSPQHYESQASNLMRSAERMANRKGDAEKIFSGSLSEMSFPEILQSIGMTKKEGILVVHGPEIGKIYLRNGAVFFARCGKVVGRKAIYRMLSWQEGSFDFRHLRDELIAEVSEEELERIGKDFQGDMTELLLEHFRIQDEFAPYRDRAMKLPERLKLSPRKKLEKESGIERVYQIYDRIKTKPLLKDILNEFPLLDSEIYRVLLFLRERGYLE